MVKIMRNVGMGGLALAVAGMVGGCATDPLTWGVDTVRHAAGGDTRAERELRENMAKGIEVDTPYGKTNIYWGKDVYYKGELCTVTRVATPYLHLGKGASKASRQSAWNKDGVVVKITDLDMFKE